MKLYNTLTRTVEPLKPIKRNQVSIYVCGATVQGSPHIGHMRTAVVFDLLRRWLTVKNYQVTLIRNVTDIDDKILHTAGHENRPWWAVAAHYEREFTNAYSNLGVLPPTAEPRATGHIPQMIELISELMANGHAYAIDGDVYFDVDTFSRYGALSNQKVKELLTSADSKERNKKAPYDFALWKSTMPGDTPSWQTPWGSGRPGWHIECSAMARFYLGKAFDIHGGGLDLAFPHHENEIAQSQAAGDDFAQVWMHSAWVTAAGEKMSKSLGNSMQVANLLNQVSGLELRYYLASAHYRSMLEFSPAALSEAATGFSRISSFIKRAAVLVGNTESGEMPAEFSTAMDDDLNLPIALSVLHETVRVGNTAITNKSKSELAELLGQVLTMTRALGICPLDAPWDGSSTGSETQVIDSLVQDLLTQREVARNNKDFKSADLIRDQLKNAGLLIEDTEQGARWSIE